MTLANGIKVAVSLALLVFVFSQIDGAAAWNAIARIGPVTIVPAVALAFVAYGARAWRWRMLLERARIDAPFGRVYRLTLLGVFYGLVTPGRVGEFARVLHLPGERTGALASAVWDRLSDVVLLVLLSVPGVIMIAGDAPLLGWAWTAIVVAAAAAFVLLRNAPLRTLLRTRFPRLAAAFPEGPRVPIGPVFMRSLAAGLLFYAVNFASAFLLLRALAPGVAPGIGVLFPIIILLGNLPIAFGGLGVREYVAAVAFAGFGAPAAIGPVFSLGWFAVMTLVPGLIGLAISRGLVRAAEPGGSLPRSSGGAPR